MRGNIEPRGSHGGKAVQSPQTVLVPVQKYFCHICSRELNFFTFIQMHNSSYCIACFARFRKWSHSYQVISKLQFTVFDHSWTAYEEIMLIKGSEKHGFGNWADIADFIDTDKTKEDVQTHYTRTYLETPNHLPETNQIAVGREINRGSKNSKKKSHRNRQSNAKRNHVSTISKQRPQSQQIAVVGYMPLREDFEFEYDNEAELLLAEMEFGEDDTAAEIEMKFKILEQYNERLTQRNKKKEFVRSRGLLDYERLSENDRQRSKQEKQIYNMMKIFERFHTAADHERLVKGLVREKVLKEKIEMYKELRNKGFTDKEAIEEQLLKRGQNNKSKKKNLSEYSYILNGYEQGRNRRLNFDNSDIALLRKNSSYFSSSQVNLCKQLKLGGTSYMMIKQTILRQSAKLEQLEREDLLTIFNMDKFIINRVIDFLVEHEGIACRG